jgi:hypothetical protein
MADPVTLMVVSTAVSAVGALQAGAAAEAQAKAQADANAYNARVKEIQAGVEREAAGRREEQQRRKARQVLGEQRAALVQSGVGMMGSALDIEEQSATAAELDALSIRYEGEMAAKGLLYDAEAEKFEGRANLAAGKNAKTASYLKAGSAILSGGTDIAMYKSR